MLHFSSSFVYALVFWIAAQGVSWGQGFTNLKIKPERLQYAREVEQDAIKKGDSLLLAEAYYLYGKTYAFTGDYKSSQSYFFKSLQILDPKGDSYELSRLYVRLSENERKQGHLKEALAYARLSLRISERIRSDQGLMRAYGALGEVYESLRNKALPDNGINRDTILYFYKQIEFLSLKLKDTLAIAEAEMRLGTFLAENNDKQSVSYLKKALGLYTLKNKDVGQLNAMLHLAATYITLGQFEQARLVLNQAEGLYDSKKLSEYDLRLLMDEQFVRYFEATDQWEKAFDQLRKLSELERLQLLSDYDGTVTRLNIEYETEKKEALLKAQKKAINLDAQNLRLQQRFTFIASALLIIAAVMSIVFFRLSRKNQRISRRNEELVKEQNHRVKNNLQVISSLLSLQAKQLTDEAAKKAVAESRLRVESMAIVHRRLYDGDKLAEVNLDEFIRELVQGVLRAYGYDYIQTDFTIDAINLSADQAVPLGLIINELTTNACKYAFPDNDNPVFRVSCLKKRNKIELKVNDNGPGWADTRLERSDVLEAILLDNRLGGEQYVMQKASFGIQLIQAQVAQLYGTCRFNSDKGVLFTMEFSM